MYKAFVRGLSDLQAMAAQVHTKARTPVYGKGKTVNRFPVPDDKVPWSVAFPEYKPTYFEDAKLKKASYADPDILNNKAAPALKFNGTDAGELNRVSHEGRYSLDPDGLPLNPRGRTGIRGRGCLGRWGPNHAADPIVTRWKRDPKTGAKVVDPASGRPVLQFVSILRGDVKEWAIPGGMVDCGEEVSATLKRENTDNAWMETVAVNFHDEDGDGLAMFQLHAGDDAIGVCWKDISRDLKLYASHHQFVEKAVQLRGAHW
uniref:39S ribosomal protein L2, mitochondrial n=1 Tax=Macrostomum lignano TaxID=282301 RepID=A0A1I8III0_9PLAT